MLHIDETTGESQIKGSFQVVMGELTMLIDHVSEIMVENGTFKNKFELMDKIREGFHFSDLVTAGMTQEEAYLASTGNTMNDDQLARAREAQPRVDAAIAEKKKKEEESKGENNA